MSRCTVRLLGRFEVRVNGHAVPVDAWRSRRAADLVKILALTPGQSMHREQVMALLWPDLGEEPAGTNLRKAVHYARRAMGADEAIRSESGLLTLWDGRAEVDAARFLAAAGAALDANDRDACARAADLYDGEALAADRYEPWAEEPRQRLRERRLAVLKGAGLWEKVLDLDPTDERSHRELMRAYLDAGERREAIRQFERLRDALREHIGVGPDPETIAVYERVLDWEGRAPEPGQRAAVLIATGLVHLHRQEFAEAERLAREARDIAVGTGLVHEAGDAGTLLALTASWTGRWYDVFTQEFAASLRRPRELTLATYCANLCLAEYHLSGATPGPDLAVYAHGLLALADEAGSAIGRGVAELMIGEAHLLAGDYAEARTWLERARTTNDAASATNGLCLTLERLAQAENALDAPQRANDLLDHAHALAQASDFRSHLLVRLLGVAVEAAGDHRALTVVTRAEHTLADLGRVCEPCSVNFRVRAAMVSARAGDLGRARRHLADAERVAGLWPGGGPWTAAVWEARAALRSAEGDAAQSVALLREAADEYARAGRRSDEERCRELALR